MKIFRIIMVLIGTIGVADTAVLSMWSNINLGIMLPAIIGAPLIIVGIFFKPLRSFTARALWLRYAFFGAYIAYALFMLIVGGMIYTSAHDDPEEGADVLIVLGCAVHGERVSLTLSYRLDRAIEYLNANPNTGNTVRREGPGRKHKRGRGYAPLHGEQRHSERARNYGG